MREETIDPLLFRAVLGRLPTGVTILAGYAKKEGPVAMACNSVTSVSLRPPLVLFCPARTSTTWPKLRVAGRLCINVLASNHAHLSRRFAEPGERFHDVAFHERPAGPALDEALAWIDCEIQAEHPAGDHTVVVAAVRALEAHPHADEPLVFFGGAYGSFAASTTGDTQTADRRAEKKTRC